jgi:hypothetical protein
MKNFSGLPILLVLFLFGCSGNRAEEADGISDHHEHHDHEQHDHEQHDHEHGSDLEQEQHSHDLEHQQESFEVAADSMEPIKTENDE